jgi:F-type H+-transporting ATPase subunit b
MQIISNIALISINETLIVQVISFLIFLFVINRIMFRPLRNVMSDRDVYIERVKLDIAEAREKIVSVTNQIQQQETTVKNEAFELKERLEKAGSAQASEIFTAVRKEIADSGKKVQMDIKARISEERQAIQKESEALALDIINKILDRRLNP